LTNIARVAKKENDMKNVFLIAVVSVWSVGLVMADTPPKLALTSEVVNPKSAPRDVAAEMRNLSVVEQPDGTFMVKGEFVVWAVTGYVTTYVPPNGKVNVGESVASAIEEGCPRELAEKLRGEFARGKMPEFQSIKATIGMRVPVGVRMELLEPEKRFGRAYYLTLEAGKPSAAVVQRHTPLISQAVGRDGVSTEVSYSEEDIRKFETEAAKAMKAGAAAGAIVGAQAGGAKL
jgi:hypothetical protein